jgi:hypothetical protein
MNDNGRPLITATRARGKAANVAMARITVPPALACCG